MKKIAIPAILAATVLVAGMFALMPVEKAQTVHTTIGTDVNKLRTVDRMILPALITIEQPNDRFVLLDLHQKVNVDGGFVVIQTTTAITAANLKLVAIAVDGTILGTSSFTDLTGGTFGVTTPYTQTLHAHIPSATGTILIALSATTANVALDDGSIITTTIESIA